jgi:nicotinate-nucleotide adenylyltransferase
MIGLFGGTFNPIHNAHLNLALTLQETCQLREVWFIPAHCSPFKMQQQDVLVPGSHRKRMVELAVEPIKDFRVLDIEIERPSPSYTIETLELLCQKYPQVVFGLMMAESVFKTLNTWHRSEELKNLVTFLVGGDLSSEGVIAVPRMDINSTMIRSRLSKGLYCGHLVPAKVLDYISENQLYSTN